MKNNLIVILSFLILAFTSRLLIAVCSNGTLKNVSGKLQNCDSSNNCRNIIGADSSGFIGIGAAPTYPVYVSIYTYVNKANFGYLNGSGTFGVGSEPSDPIGVYASERIVSGELGALSDRRMKEDIKEISEDEATAMIQKLKPVRFRWIKSKSKAIGFIAQDLIRAGLNQMVSVAEDRREPLLRKVIDADGFVSPEGSVLSMNYDQMTAIVAKGAQTFHRDVEALNAELESVSSELQALQADL